MADDVTLPPEARTALAAYRAMSASKTEYFNLLQQLDQKYRDHGAATVVENLNLEKLLRSHGEKVAAFNNAMQAVTDKTTREELLKYLMAYTAPQKME